MQLVESLASGVVGAENGYAKLYNRGTSTLSTCYADFEGTVRAQPAAGFALDSYGSLVVYVNALADVAVFDSTGTAIREFTTGNAAPDVEVQSLAFTGVAYQGGASAAGNPTTLQAVLDLWKTNAGTADWKVLLGGSAVTLQVALGTIYGLFINVKGSPYNAVGDGVTDDTTAVQAALTAASGGAIVVFPSGTYRITSKLTVPTGASLWGVSASGSIIKMDHATADTLEYGAGASVMFQEIRNLAIYPAQANSGKPISMLATFARKLLVVNSVLNYNAGASLYSGSIISIASATHQIILDTTDVYTQGAAVSSTLGARVTVRGGSRLVVTPTNWATILLVSCDNLTLNNAELDMSATTSGTPGYGWGIVPSAAIKVQVTGCKVTGGTATYGFAMLGAGNYVGLSFVESATTFVGSTLIPFFGFFGSGSNRPVIHLGSRDGLIETLPDTASPIAVNAHTYGTTTLTCSSAGARTVNSATVGPEGAFWTLEVINTSGSTVVFTPGTGFAVGVPTMSVPTGKRGIYSFRSVVDTSGGVWVPMAAQIVTT